MLRIYHSRNFKIHDAVEFRDCRFFQCRNAEPFSKGIHMGISGKLSCRAPNLNLFIPSYLVTVVMSAEPADYAVDHVWCDVFEGDDT